MSKDKEIKIGVFVATLIGVNAMIGAGILALPALIANIAGPAGIISFMMSISIGILLGLSLARLAIIHPGKGWNYLYPSLWGGHVCGIIASLAYLFGIIIAMGFLVQQAGVWIHPFIPNFAPDITGLFVLAALTLLVIAGNQIASWGQYIIAACVVVPLFVTASICWMHFDSNVFTNFMPHGISSLFSAAVVSLFSFLGFETSLSLYSSLKNPSRTIVLSIIFSIMIVGALYTFFTAGILFSIPLSLFKHGLNEPLPLVLQRSFSHYFYLPILLMVGGLFAILGTLHSMIWSVGALFYDVLSKFQSHQIVRALQTNAITPHRVVVFTSIAIGLSSLSVGGQNLVILSVVLIIMSYMLSIVYLLLQPNEWKSGYAFIALGAFMSCLALLYNVCAPLLGYL